MRSWIRTAVVTALALGLLALFLRNANLQEVWRVMRQARLGLVAAGVGLLFFGYACRTARWQVMLMPIGPTRFAVALRATIIGFAASFVLPARAGEVIRPWLLARREGLPVAAAFATILLERVLDLVTVLVLLGLYFVAFDPGLSAMDPAMYAAVRGGALLAALAAAIGLGVMLACAADPARLGRLVAWSTGWLPQRPRQLVTGLSQSFAEGLAAVRDPRQLVLALVWSVPLWLAIAAQIWVVSLALGVVLPPAGSLLVTALLVVGVAVPTPGAVGGYHEAYRLSVTSFFAIDNDRAVAAAIVLHAVGFIPTLIAGAWMMAMEGLSPGSLAAQTRETQETRP
ncbi:MAG: lysylphosphatidylglycerol synthase transmembrane domain-containing protein [Vicinamibacterales bacterium]